jgi:signal transduction histidine kinase/DNA-binding response OmpR family regulator
MQEVSQTKSPDFLSGGGEMGKRIRDFDWSKTCLGDPEHWDQSLKTCVRIMLSSSQPIWIGWGSELIKLYNDPYIAIVAGMHPQALGQPASIVWKDIWKDIGPMLSKAMEKDEGSYVESKLLIMHRSGYPEETYYTFSYTPVLGENGKPAGIICYNTADTERIINERSLQTLRQLDALGQKKTELEVYQQAMKAIDSNKKDFPFAIFYKIDSEGTSAWPVAFEGIDTSENQLLQTFDLSHSQFISKDLTAAVLENKLVESQNEGRWNQLPKGDWDIMPQSFVYVPIRAANKKYPLAILFAALNPYRKFDEGFRNFVQLIGDQISLHVNNAIAYEEERKRAEALEALDKAKTAFFSNISHEFRTPITLMLGPLEELLNKSKKFDDTEIQSIEAAHRNTMRLLRLVNTLLDFSRIESGRQRAVYSPVDLASYTSELASNFRSVIEKAGLKFIVETEKIDLPVYIDKQMWEKIVFNLLSNAFKYTLNGSISIKVAAQSDAAVLQIVDTGIGIPEEELPLMFERFHRVQHSSGRTYEGTGIGLSLIKEFVKLHGGTIGVTSKLGEGSTFTVIIPLGKNHLPPSNIAENGDMYEDVVSSVFIEEASTLLETDNTKSTFKSNSPDNNIPNVARVLVVDDNSDMRDHIRHVLSSKFNVTTAIHGADALKKIKAEPPDLVLSDIMMPVMDGIDLLKKIKSDHVTAQIPVILLTARAGEESRISGFETGADDYLIKPFTGPELITRIKSQIHLAQARKEVAEKLKGLLMQAPAAIAIMEGPDHMVTMANNRFLKMYARTEGEIIGKVLRDVYPEVEGQGIYELFDQVYNTGESFTAREFQATFNSGGDRKTGYYDFVIHPIRNNNGKITDLMLHAVDVTESVLARKEVESSKARLNNIIAQVQAGIAQADLDGMLIDVNDRFCEMVGKTKEELIGTQIDDLTHPNDQPRSKQLFRICAETGKSYTIRLNMMQLQLGIPQRRDYQVSYIRLNMMQLPLGIPQWRDYQVSYIRLNMMQLQLGIPQWRDYQVSYIRLNTMQLQLGIPQWRDYQVSYIRLKKRPKFFRAIVF